MSRNSNQIEYRVSSEINKERLHTIKYGKFPLYFVLNIDYIGELARYTNHRIQRDQLDYAKEFKYFKINDFDELIRKSTFNCSIESGDFFIIEHDGFSWNFLTIKKIIPSKDIPAISKLLGIKSLKVKFDD